MESLEKSQDVADEVQSVNVNAKWAALKEVAFRNILSIQQEMAHEGVEREKYRRRGKMLLGIMQRLPENADRDFKERTLGRIEHVVERAGLAEGLTEALESKQRYELEAARIGEKTFAEKKDLTPEEEIAVEQLRERVVDLTKVESGALGGDFPSGNYLYHGSTVEHVEEIFNTGGLKNGIALQEDNPKVSAFDLNSGFEGLSWSMNAIDALPGTRRHLAGFLAAPEDLLGDGTQLVVPSRPAPYEVLQVSETLRPQELYATKNQLETWGDGGISLGERNNVDSNLMRMLMYDKNRELFSSMVYSYQGDLSPDKLREHYTLDEKGSVIWDEDLYQKSEMPPALPWMQSLIDSEMLVKNGYEDLDSVEKIVERTKIDKDFLKRLLATERNTASVIKQKYNEMLEDATAVRVRPEKMYFVTSHHDLEAWLKVMARTGARPKGILLYDDEGVVMENFASQFDGNHEELSREIGNAVGVNQNFWRDSMGMQPEVIPRSGHRGQVLLESAVKRDKVIRLDEGKLKVVAV